MLTYAEAKIKAGEIDASVLEAINKVRQRPSVKMPPITTTDPNELFYAVARERKYEFSGEGLRLFDIRRWKIAETVMNQPLLGRMKKSYPDKAPRIDEWGTAFYEGIPIAESGESADFKMRVVDIRKFDKNRDYLWPIPYIERQTNPITNKFAPLIFTPDGAWIPLSNYIRGNFPIPGLFTHSFLNSSIKIIT